MKKPLSLLAVGISIGFGFAGLANSDTQTGGNQPRLVRDFFLCESGHSGQIETYSCREYEQESRTVRVFFKGSDIPRAISSFSGKNASTLVPMSKESDVIANRLKITPTAGIPVYRQTYQNHESRLASSHVLPVSNVTADAATSEAKKN